MTTAIPALPVDIIQTRIKGPPQRGLELICRVKNPTSSDLAILVAWITVETLNGLSLGEGWLFHSMHNRVDPAIIRAGDRADGAILIGLPATVLHQIEDRRQGNDIELRISSRVTASIVEQVNDRRILGLPFETSFGQPTNGYLEYRIPQSDWVQNLKTLGWSELEILELPSARLRADPRLGRALGRLEDALECHRRGEWEEAMANCRKAFEAVMLDVSGKDDMRQASEETLRALVGDTPKVVRLNKVISELSKYLHLARHEASEPILVTRADAQLSIHLTAALLDYLANA